MRLVPKSEWKKRHKETRQLLSITDEAVAPIILPVRSQSAFTRCCPTKPAGFVRRILIGRRGDKMPLPSWSRPRTGTLRQRWSGRALVTGPMSGFSSRLQSQRRWPQDWETALLTRTMERRHQLGLRSYDRLFPNQDTMPLGGFGNLIALPLQKIPRKSGNSFLLDDSLEPITGLITRAGAFHGQSQDSPTDPPLRGEAACQLCCPAPLACGNHSGASRTRFRDRPETVRLHPGITFARIPTSEAVDQSAAGAGRAPGL